MVPYVAMLDVPRPVAEYLARLLAAQAASMCRSRLPGPRHFSSSPHSKEMIMEQHAIECALFASPASSSPGETRRVLRAELTNRGPTARRVESVTVKIDAADRHPAPTAALQASGAGWHTPAPDHTDGVHTYTAHGSTLLEPGQCLTFNLSEPLDRPCRVRTAVGDAESNHYVSEHTPPPGTGDYNSTTLSDFAAEQLAISRGGKVRFTWTTPSENPSWDQYTVERTDVKGDFSAPQKLANAGYTPGKDETKSYFEVNQLTQTTAFRIGLATKINGQPATAYSPVRMVTVTNGDISAGNLSANGTVTLLQCSNTFKYNNTTSAENHNKKLDGIAAPTDGYLVGNLHYTQQPDEDNPGATITITPPGGTEQQNTIIPLFKKDAGTENFCYPVPKDSRLTIKADTQINGTIVWMSMGTGKL
ncbi:hypothetical protein LKL35_37405 [Streptomyces sp. ET3-23]|uniref:hypothetical protein n=1 Tax=Streptomyces sp. ET3-23 TaxID=2885643 RepID=UPI001D10B4A9|nr:hypothetical protein [Streptomyces sp. ET3-23]MCC2280983.1 hypothetical protein [Streptomyces sp. ET3-23]